MSNCKFHPTHMPFGQTGVGFQSGKHGRRANELLLRRDPHLIFKKELRKGLISRREMKTPDKQLCTLARVVHTTRQRCNWHC